MNSDDYELVYSSESPGKKLSKNKKSKHCVAIDPASTTLKLRLEKNKRGGKTVTIVYEVPNNPEYFKKILKKLKSKCGTGGALKADTLEIQGDHRQEVRTQLEKIGFKVKGH
mgnify:CR=1 FL=1